MPKGFLAKTDTGLLAWSANFSEKINLAPGDYGISVPQAENYAILHANYAAAFRASDPSVRSRVTTSSKNSARRFLKTDASFLARIVYGTASVSDAQKVLLGLTVRRPPVRIPAPTAAPGLTIASVTGRAVAVKLYDLDVTGRTKPDGVAGATLFSFTGEQPPVDLAAWKLETSVTRSTAKIVFPSTLAPGATVWLIARWFNPRSQPGPMGRPVYTTFGAADLVLIPNLARAA